MPSMPCGSQLYLTGMDAGADLQVGPGQALPQVHGAADGSAWPFEGGEDAVTSRLDELARMGLDSVLRQTVVQVEHGSPAPVSQLLRLAGGTNDVGEQHRGELASARLLTAEPDDELLDRIERELGTIPIGRQVTTGKFYQASPLDVIGDVSPPLGR